MELYFFSMITLSADTHAASRSFTLHKDGVQYSLSPLSRLYFFLIANPNQAQFKGEGGGGGTEERGERVGALMFC